MCVCVRMNIVVDAQSSVCMDTCTYSYESLNLCSWNVCCSVWMGFVCAPVCM